VPAWIRSVSLAASLVLSCQPLGRAQVAPLPPTPLTRAQIEDFLEHAPVIRHASLSRGTTKPSRLTLSDGALTHDAVFQGIDELVQRQEFAGGRIELNFRDSYHFNIAAYRLAALLGIGDMVPVTVERTWNGRKGSLSWWIDWKWDELMRRKQGIDPPPELAQAYSNQVHVARVFGQLVYDTDRNQTNTLISADWKLYMVDFSRAFRSYDMLPHEESILRCSADMVAKMKALTRESVSEATAGHLEPSLVTGLLVRRDKIVARLEALAKERGEKAVLF
jgi:hypothetical protein